MLMHWSACFSVKLWLCCCTEKVDTENLGLKAMTFEFMAQLYQTGTWVQPVYIYSEVSCAVHTRNCRMMHACGYCFRTCLRWNHPINMFLSMLETYRQCWQCSKTYNYLKVYQNSLEKQKFWQTINHWFAFPSANPKLLTHSVCLLSQWLFVTNYGKSLLTS